MAGKSVAIREEAVNKKITLSRNANFFIYNLWINASINVYFAQCSATKPRGETSSGSLSTQSTVHHGPFRGRWLYGSPSLEQQQQQQNVNSAFSGDHTLDYRMPDVYGRHNEYLDSPRANPLLTPLCRKVGYLHS